MVGVEGIKTRAVHQQVDPLNLPLQLPPRLGDRGVIAHIAAERKDVVAEIPAKGLDRARAPCRGDDVVATVGTLPNQLVAQAAAGPGDKNDGHAQPVAARLVMARQPWKATR